MRLFFLEAGRGLKPPFDRLASERRLKHRPRMNLPENPRFPAPVTGLALPQVRWSDAIVLLPQVEVG